MLFSRAKRAGRGGDKAILKRKPGPPDFAPIAFGSYMLEGRLNRKDKDRVTSFEKLRNVCFFSNLSFFLYNFEQIHKMIVVFLSFFCKKIWKLYSLRVSQKFSIPIMWN